jgi:hypothetical protein
MSAQALVPGIFFGLDLAIFFDEEQRRESRGAFG